jgi:hypothetical protein
MKRTFTAILALAASLLIAPGVSGAPLKTGLGFAFAENTPAGTHFWCGFPDVPGHWIVVLYERDPLGPSLWQRHHYIFTPLAGVTKPAGASGPLFIYQMMTVPPHAGKDCFLVAYRDGIQQPYIGFSEYNPFGWHVFGLQPPLQARVAEIPAGTSTRDIIDYERTTRNQWAYPLPLPQ